MYLTQYYIQHEIHYGLQLPTTLGLLCMYSVQFLIHTQMVASRWTNVENEK